jgi:hypothetical protein
MKAIRIPRGELPKVGQVLSRGVGKLPKGAILSEGNVVALHDAPWKELHVVEMEAGDLHEDQAGRRLAQAAAGDGVEVQPLNAGSWPLTAKHRGLVEPDEERIAQVNQIEDLAFVTLPRAQIVVENELVARAKVVPFVTREERVRQAEAVGALVRVRPFVPMRVAALVQEELDDTALARFRKSFEEKLSFFGSNLMSVQRVTGDLVAALRDCIAQGAQLVAMAGSKLMDPLDPVLQGLSRAGAKIEKHGVPIHPGTLLWVARLDDVPLIGAPGCALFSKPTAFDVLLARLLAGDRLTRTELASLGAGGLITKEMAFRFPPYRPGSARGELDAS